MFIVRWKPNDVFFTRGKYKIYSTLKRDEKIEENGDWSREESSTYTKIIGIYWTNRLESGIMDFLSYHIV